MSDSFSRAISKEIKSIREALVTREFWIYVGAILALLLVGIGGAYFALGFDNLTREKLMMVLACKAGEKQLLVIIVGSIVFCLLSFFALGEVTAWVEERRKAKSAGWKMNTSIWRPVIFFGGAILLGIAGAVTMSLWCI